MNEQGDEAGRAARAGLGLEVIVALAAAFLAVVTAEAYLAGYAYLTGFYAIYDISVWELDLSFEDVLAHSVTPAIATAMNRAGFAGG